MPGTRWLLTEQPGVRHRMVPGDFELGEGETLRMRHRVLLYVGAPDAEALEAEWRAYGAAPDGEKGEPSGSTGRY